MLTFSTSALSTGGAVTWGGGGVGVTDSTVGNFAGCTVVVDEAVNTVAPGSTGHQTEFFCYLTSQGAIQEGIQKDQLIEAERNILSSKLLCHLITTTHIMLWVLSGMMLLTTQLMQT